MVTGARHWKLGRIDSYLVNPPLIRVTAAIPLLAHSMLFGDSADYQSQKFDTFFEGRRFMESGGRLSENLIFLGRLCCLPYCILGGVGCFCWASDLYGRRAGWVACALWSFSPDILGHGSLLTPDAHAAGLLAIAAFWYWRWLRSCSCLDGIVAGIALGFACLAKTTLLLCFPLWGMLWLIRRTCVKQRGNFVKEFLLLCGIFAIGLNILCLGYGFDGVPSRGDRTICSSRLFRALFHPPERHTETSRAIASLLQAPLPLPLPYVSGIDEQLANFDNPILPSYLGGHFRQRGWWYFYLYAMLFKTPSAILALLAWSVAELVYSSVAAIGSLRSARESPQNDRSWRDLRGNCHWVDEIFVVAAGAVFLIVISSQVGFSKHPRYAFPVYPFLFVWISRVFRENRAGDGWRDVASRRTFERRMVLPYILLICAVLSGLAAAPNHLSYFNELAGGLRGGSSHLIDSAVDWGQDLYHLRTWRNKNPGDSLYVALYCDIDPRAIGIDCKPAPQPSQQQKLPPGYYAISVSILQGMSWHSSPDSAKRFGVYPPNAFRLFRDNSPIAFVGGSIVVYEIK